MCSVGPGGTCWAVDEENSVYRRVGAKTTNPIGTKWQAVNGKLSLISVGRSGVWGITSEGEVSIFTI